MTSTPMPADDALALATQMVHRLAQRTHAKLIETHLSWVLLAGESACKIKKPLHLSFVDYSTLAERRRCCEEELRLNRRLAPGVYRDVVAVTGCADDPQWGGHGPAIEYAVCMRRFADDALLSTQLQAGTLTSATIDACADLLAQFHAAAPVAPADDGFARPAQRMAVACAALAGATPVCRGDEAARLSAWLHEQAALLAPLWTERLEQGRVRECHGDLHLDNLIEENGVVSAFDGIEFDPALHWIDVIDDIAFPVMDLQAHGRTDLAFRLLDRWLDGTGDHAALPALRFALVYRALVRAQVMHLQDRTEPARRYLASALHWIAPAAPWLAIMHGLPGSGKSFVSQRLLERHGAIRVRSDVERKRLFGLAALDDSRARGLHIYDRDAGSRTYAALLAAARAALAGHFPVILDAAHLNRAERTRAARLARELGVTFRIVACEADDAVLRERLRQRKGDASEADEQVLDHLRGVVQPLTPGEQSAVWHV